jgi:hypothetical protein
MFKGRITHRPPTVKREEQENDFYAELTKRRLVPGGGALFNE